MPKILDIKDERPAFASKGYTLMPIKTKETPMKRAGRKSGFRGSIKISLKLRL